MANFLCCDGDPFDPHSEFGGKGGAVSGKGRGADDQIDIVDSERRLVETAASCLRRSHSELPFLCDRCAESKNVTCVSEPDRRAKALTIVRAILPMEPA
jgi:hypothetical protein